MALDPGSSPHINAVTADTYDGLDRLLTVTDPVGRVTFNDYDAAGQLERIIRAHGHGVAAGLCDLCVHGERPA